MKVRERSVVVKAATAIALSAFIAAGIIVNYRTKPGRFFEMTFLSNTLTFTVLAVGAMRLLFSGKDIPQYLYLDCTALLLTVTGVCVFFAPRVCFLGESVLLHLVNPLLMLAFYLLFCDGRAESPWTAFTALIFPSCYYIFMIIYGRVTSDYIYSYFDPNVFSPAGLLGIAAVAELVVMAFAFLSMLACRLLRSWSPRPAKQKNSRAL